MSLQTDVVGLLTWDYARPKGGLGRALQEAVKMLRAAGRTVYVASPQTEEPLLPLTETYSGHVLFSLLLPFVLRRRMRVKNVRMLLLPVGPGGVLLLRSPGVPYCAIVYHTYAQQAAAVPGQRWKRMFVPLERLTLRRAQRIICYCADTRRVLIERYGIAPRNIDLCTQALDAAAWKGEEKKQQGLCVCVARLEARKGVDVLLRAWPVVMRAVTHAQLVIVGDGVLAPQVDSWIAQQNGSVTRRASVPFEDLRVLVARAEVAVCPAYLEGFGLAAAEAMAAGTLTVAADSDGLRSLVTHNVTGLLVPPGDTAGLATAIIRALTDGPARERIATAGAVHIQNACSPARAARDLAAAVEAAEVTGGSR